MKQVFSMYMKQIFSYFEIKYSNFQDSKGPFKENIAQEIHILQFLNE